MNVHVFLTTTLKDDYPCFGDKDTLDTETWFAQSHTKASYMTSELHLSLAVK